MNKYKWILWLIFWSASLSSYAQVGASKDKMEAIKIGFITEKIDLSPTQASAFWPVYNEYASKKKEIRGRISMLLIDSKLSNLTEDQISSELKQYFLLKQQEIELDQEYYSKFTKSISTRQVAKLYNAEREFVKILLKKLESN